MPALICAAAKTILWKLRFLSLHSCWKQPKFSRDARTTFQTGSLYSAIWNNPGLSSSLSQNVGNGKLFRHILRKTQSCTKMYWYAVISKNCRNNVKDCCSIHEGECQSSFFFFSMPSLCVKLTKLASNTCDPSMGAESHPRRRQHLTGEELASVQLCTYQSRVVVVVVFFFFQ